MSKRVRVVLVEDDAEIRYLVRRVLSEDPTITFLKAYPNGDAFLRDHTGEGVDVVVMDINMPGSNGIDCVARAKPVDPRVQYIISTVFENPSYIFQALCAGATGYLLKSLSAQELVPAIHGVMEGGSPMSPAIARLVVSSFQGQARASISDQQLTAREREIVDGLAAGLMYKEIADKAGISIGTVRVHIRNIYEKLHVSSRHEAVKKVYPGGGPRST
ncbi:MAG: response regulator transcription factor [Flavobacteriales bacterium]|nr:response regulator transcription factor [Flavobacteriales bacterium]